MSEYHKIQTVCHRDPATKHKTLIEGRWSKPEFEILSGALWELTEKVDGANIRVIWNGDKVEFRGRTDRAEIPAQLLEHLTSTFPADKFRNQFGDKQVVLYGEGYGNKIQKVGHLYGEDQRFVLFDVYIGKWLEREGVFGVGLALGVKVVPTLGLYRLPEAIELCRNGFNSRWGDFQAEGVIARPVMELLDANGRRIITKIKCGDFRRG